LLNQTVPQDDTSLIVEATDFHRSADIANKIMKYAEFPAVPRDLQLNRLIVVLLLLYIVHVQCRPRMIDSFDADVTVLVSFMKNAYQEVMSIQEK
jgi:hypothetical protein